METTIRTDRRRKGAAVALVGLGIATLGLASASHLLVTAEPDTIASGAVEVEGFLSDEATAEITVAADKTDLAETMATADTLPTSVTLKVEDPQNPGVRGLADVYLYDGTETVASAIDVPVTVGTAVDVGSALGLTDGVLPDYDRAGVVVTPAAPFAMEAPQTILAGEGVSISGTGTPGARVRVSVTSPEVPLPEPKMFVNETDTLPEFLWTYEATVSDDGTWGVESQAVNAIRSLTVSAVQAVGGEESTPVEKTVETTYIEPTITDVRDGINGKPAVITGTGHNLRVGGLPALVLIHNVPYDESQECQRGWASGVFPVGSDGTWTARMSPEATSHPCEWNFEAEQYFVVDGDAGAAAVQLAGPTLSGSFTIDDPVIEEEYGPITIATASYLHVGSPEVGISGQCEAGDNTEVRVTLNGVTEVTDCIGWYTAWMGNGFSRDPFIEAPGEYDVLAELLVDGDVVATAEKTYFVSGQQTPTIDPIDPVRVGERATITGTGFPGEEFCLAVGVALADQQHHLTDCWDAVSIHGASQVHGVKVAPDGRWSLKTDRMPTTGQFPVSAVQQANLAGDLGPSGEFLRTRTAVETVRVVDVSPPRTPVAFTPTWGFNPFAQPSPLAPH